VPPRGGTGKSLRGCRKARAGLAAGVGVVRETTAKLGCCPTVACGVRSTLRAGGSRVHEPGRRRSGLAYVARWLASRRRTRYRARPAACVDARDRTRNRGGVNSREGEAQESTDPAVPPWPGLRDRSGTDSRGEQSFEAGVPVAHTASPVLSGRGRRALHVHGRVEATGLAIAGKRRHGSVVHGPPPGGSGAKSWRGGESDRESPGGSAPAVIGDETRKEARGLRERVRLLGKGKLWRAVPGTRAAWNKAAKRRAPRRTAGSERISCVPRAESLNRREGQEP